MKRPGRRWWPNDSDAPKATHHDTPQTQHTAHGTRSDKRSTTSSTTATCRPRREEVLARSPRSTRHPCNRFHHPGCNHAPSRHLRQVHLRSSTWDFNRRTRFGVLACRRRWPALLRALPQGTLYTPSACTAGCRRHPTSNSLRRWGWGWPDSTASCQAAGSLGWWHRVGHTRFTMLGCRYKHARCLAHRPPVNLPQLRALRPHRLTQWRTRP